MSSPRHDVAHTVYLAGPIAAVGRERAIVYREELARYLRDNGVTCFNPAGAWSVATLDHVSRVQLVDDLSLMCCHAMVVCVTGHVSPGTDHEIALAKLLGMPTSAYRLPDTTPEVFDTWLLRRPLQESMPLMETEAEVLEWLNKLPARDYGVGHGERLR